MGQKVLGAGKKILQLLVGETGADPIIVGKLGQVVAGSPVVPIDFGKVRMLEILMNLRVVQRGEVSLSVISEKPIQAIYLPLHADEEQARH